MAGMADDSLDEDEILGFTMQPSGSFVPAEPVESDDDDEIPDNVLQFPTASSRPRAPRFDDD